MMSALFSFQVSSRAGIARADTCLRAQPHNVLNQKEHVVFLIASLVSQRSVSLGAFDHVEPPPEEKGSVEPVRAGSRAARNSRLRCAVHRRRWRQSAPPLPSSRHG